MIWDPDQAVLDLYAGLDAWLEEGRYFNSWYLDLALADGSTLIIRLSWQDPASLVRLEAILEEPVIIQVEDTYRVRWRRVDPEGVRMIQDLPLEHETIWTAIQELIDQVHARTREEEER